MLKCIKERYSIIQKLGLLTILSLSLSSCLIKDKTSATSINDEDSLPDIRTSSLMSGEPNATVYEGVPYSYTPDSLASGAVVTAVNLPSWMSLNSATGVIQGTASGHQDINNITLTARLGKSFTEIGPFSLTILGDPLFSQQWHLINNGQRAFATSSGTSGVDLNLRNTF